MAEPKSLIQIISEEEFLLLLETHCNQLLNIYFLYKVNIEGKKEISRKFYSNLIQEAEYLESFMDEYGARENKTWAFFVEFLASIRNLAIAAFYTRHILDRYPYYNLRESSQNKNNFNTEACGVLKFLNQSILNLFEELHSDAISNGLKVSAELKKQIELTDIEINKRLPRNILEDQIKDEEDRIVEVCHKIQHVFKLMQDANVHRITDLNELKLSVLQKFNEKLARMYKNLVHNIQSDYDTYVKNTKLEQEHKDLKVMRGYISMALHLLEISLWLAHFYERHEDDIRHGESKKRISLRVNKSILLEKIMNFGFVNSFHFVTEGNKLAI